MVKAWKSPLRLYLTGRVTAELGGERFDERSLRGRQGRRAFVYLALERARPVAIDELADAVWGTSTPAGAWETALSAIVSHVRACLRQLDRQGGVQTVSGCYQLAVPSETWVDVEAAQHALEEAEAHVRADRTRDAWGPANVAASIAARPLLAGLDGDWITRARHRLRDTHVRALDCLAAVALATGEHPLAARLAHEITELEPFHETGWQRLMRAHAAGGNRAEALHVYARCRKLLADELGIAPSPETEALARALRGADDVRQSARGRSR